MDIESAKLELVKLIVNIDNKRVIDGLIEAIKSGEGDFWPSLSQGVKDEIRLGIKHLDAGQRIRLDEFIAKVS